MDKLLHIRSSPGKFIHDILVNATLKNASDLHFEPFETQFVIRMRIDGQLFKTHTLPKNQQQLITSRLKLEANLDISQTRLPQDGRFSLQHDSQTMGIRINTCPTLFGEKVVLRILPKPKFTDNLAALGLDAIQEKTIFSVLNKPQGLIIVTGPTGSGKTCALYTFLTCLNPQTTNIMTIEDPVEIPLEGINQVPIDPKRNFSFHHALRSLLRQDPDVMMIGEIRDKETAQIAIKAAQTGHLVLATLHTNGTWQTINRLLQMDIAPYQLVSALSLITASRLVRKLCKHCKIRIQHPLEAFLNQGLNHQLTKGFQCYQEQGCSQCHQGFKGRVGVHEVIKITAPFQECILNPSTLHHMPNLLKKEHITSLSMSGYSKVIKGITSLREIQDIIDVND